MGASVVSGSSGKSKTVVSSGGFVGTVTSEAFGSTVNFQSLRFSVDVQASMLLSSPGVMKTYG